jgi:hypothetical protein
MKIKNDNRCRACGHAHFWEIYSGEIKECIFNCGCEAEDWIPYDNLEYLAYLYEVKHAINSN